MTKPDIQKLYDVTEATWPPAARFDLGPVTLRDGAGGGKRVSAATAQDGWSAADLDAAEARMNEMGQQPLFMIREGQDDLDAALDAMGYKVIDPVYARMCPVSNLTDLPIPRVTAFAIWEPLAIMRDIWAEGGIGAERLAVMDRACDPKTGILGRVDDKPAATAFAAIHDGVAMVHAVETRVAHRRKGMGKWVMRQAAHWAAANGADWIAILVTTGNESANALYESLGMEIVGKYHYRIKA